MAGMFTRISSFVLLLALAFTAPVVAEDFAVKSYDMRGDMGVLQDFGPRGVCWMPDGQLLVADRRYTVFHIFDTQGRRFLYMSHPDSKQPEAYYNGMCVMPDGKYLVAGSHYHVKNNPRYVTAHSVIHLMKIEGEAFSADSGKVNYSPDTALRKTGYYGDSADQHLEISGIAVDAPGNRVFLACTHPMMPDGTFTIFEGKLDKFQLRSDDFQLEVVKTGLVPPIDTNLMTPYLLSDITYVPNKGLVLLLASQSSTESTFGDNQIYFMKGGFGPAKLVQKDLAKGNRATGIAVRPGKVEDEYEAAIVCDNKMEDTKVPSRLLMLQGLRFPQR